MCLNCTLRKIAKLIGFMWRDESLEVKKYYEDEAASRKLEHMVKYPGTMVPTSNVIRIPS